MTPQADPTKIILPKLKTPEVVPCHWRNGGPILLASDIDGSRGRPTGTPVNVEWSAGKGPLVQGPIQQLLLALAGRRADMAQLTGAGLEALGRD